MFLKIKKQLYSEYKSTIQFYPESNIDDTCSNRKIVDGLNYYPEDKELYSTTGCKRVAQRVSLYIADERRSQRKKGRKEL